MLVGYRLRGDGASDVSAWPLESLGLQSRRHGADEGGSVER